MKYVMFKDARGDRAPVLFAAPVAHREVARAFAALGWQPVSAGAVEILPPPGPGGVTLLRAIGRSETLDLGPAEGDAALITALHLGTVALFQDHAPALRP